ncbi:MAG: DNA primase [Chloroflexota bacterium]
MSVTQEIKSRLDIVDIVSEQVQLRRSGRNLSGFCPFHQNSRTPAFYVFPETQTWRCFGACADGGDLFSYVMKKEGYDFKEALEHLARRAGVTLEPKKPVDKVKKAFQEKMADLSAAAADYFHQLLLYAPQAEQARRYVKERGLTDETLASFQIGFSLDSWDACRSHFNAQGYSDDDLLKAGLLTENPDKGTRYDRFRGRLMFTIRNLEGQVVGFGARTLQKDGIPKYLNSPQTAVFDKSRILYGLDLAKRQIREARQAIIVEGYMDVIQAHQAGFRNVVAQMGTALTEQQLRYLKRYTKRFVLALDADAAGMQATMRGLQVARETLDKEYETRFDAQGLIRHEARLKADIRVVTMPEGEDPDSIIRANPARWPQLLAQANPIVDYVIMVATRDLDLNDAKAKSAVAKQVLPLISDIADPVEREHYRQLLARSLQVDERTLRQMPVQQKMRFQPPPQPANGFPPEPDAPPPPGMAQNPIAQARPQNNRLGTNRQSNFMRHCLQYPNLLVQVNQTLRQAQQPSVEDQDFAVPEDRELIGQIYQQVRQGVFAPLIEVCDSLDEVLLARTQSLAKLPLTSESKLEYLSEKLAHSVLDWRSARIKQQNRELQQLLRSQEDSSLEQKTLYQQIIAGNQELLKINKAKEAMSAVGRRRAENGV